MSLLRICAEPGCGTRTLGRFCIDHELVRARVARRRETGPPGTTFRRRGSPLTGTGAAGLEETPSR
jgi:hypothetical protein